MKHFKPSEFACKCGCGFDAIDPVLVEILDDVRDHFDSPLIVNSGCRCSHRNAAVGGKPHSYHLAGRAADVWSHGATPTEIYNYIDQKHRNTLGIICYPSFVHVDTRLKPYRMGPA